MEYQSKYINGNSEQFDKVKNLWRSNSSTLGYFPEGAFEEYAANGCILVGECDNDFAGYVLYRKVKGHSPYPQAAIVHLCIVPQYRKHGIAKYLVEQLCSQLQKNYLHIRLNCRKDYSLDEFWIKLGFSYKSETEGRSGNILVKWERVFRELPLPLIEFATQLQKPKQYRVVIDANICYRLQDPPPDNETEPTLSLEAKALEADWLKEDIELVVTSELLNEIQRNKDKDKRKRRLSFANQFKKITNDFSKVEEKLQLLDGLFPESSKDKMRSDMYQVAHTAAGGFLYFVTQDQHLLNKSSEISDRLGVTTLSPGELISHIDEISKADEYQPRRLAGLNRLHTSKVSANQIDTIYDCFKDGSRSERKTYFLNRLRSYLSLPQEYEQKIYSQSDKKVAFVVHDRSVDKILSIPTIRFARTDIHSTIVRYVLRNIVVNSIEEKRAIVAISESECDDGIITNALIENNFVRCDGYWVKINLYGIADRRQVVNALRSIKTDFSQYRQAIETLTAGLEKAEAVKCHLSLVDIEKKLYPLKISGSLIPTYVVPIKPGWAQHLFDQTIAEQNLFGADEDLMMRLENVFYRSKHSFGKISAPARILWYVTSSKGYVGSKMVRACSYLDEVKVGRATDLYKKYRRIGVYRWSNVAELVDGEEAEDIMAIIFNNTELLMKPVPFNVYKKIVVKEEGRSPVVQSPQEISESTFFSLYSYSLTGSYE